MVLDLEGSTVKKPIQIFQIKVVASCQPCTLNCWVLSNKCMLNAQFGHILSGKCPGQKEKCN